MPPGRAWPVPVLSPALVSHRAWFQFQLCHLPSRLILGTCLHVSDNSELL